MIAALWATAVATMVAIIWVGILGHRWLHWMNHAWYLRVVAVGVLMFAAVWWGIWLVFIPLAIVSIGVSASCVLFARAIKAEQKRQPAPWEWTP